MKTRKIILASVSPRRRELLSKMRLSFKVVQSDYEENMLLKLPPKILAKHLSLGKAQSVAKKYKNAIVIGADTFVVYNNQVLGKPKDTQDARAMLKMLSGTAHSIITGVTVIDTSSGKTISQATETKIFVKKLSNSEIDNYIKSGEPMDKAGAYAIQELGAVLIENIQGDYMSAIGLSLYALSKIFKKFGIRVL